jgi:hypothetical protein
VGWETGSECKQNPLVLQFFKAGSHKTIKLGWPLTASAIFRKRLQDHFSQMAWINKRPTTSTTWKPSGWSGKAVTLRLVEIFNGHRLDLLESVPSIAPDRSFRCVTHIDEERLPIRENREAPAHK